MKHLFLLFSLMSFSNLLALHVETASLIKLSGNRAVSFLVRLDDNNQEISKANGMIAIGNGLGNKVKIMLEEEYLPVHIISELNKHNIKVKSSIAKKLFDASFFITKEENKIILDLK